MRHTLSAVVAAASAAILSVGTARGEFADFRAIFVNRFEYAYTTQSIDAIMQNAADLGITDVMFQVRGRADAFYTSAFEPRALGLPANFDPLQTAIDAAHSRGMKLHAWMNATPMWNSDAVNPPAGHIFHNANPSFRLYDINGNPEPQLGWSNYASVNPVLPEVHTHINNVVNDIATNYAVDGVHLDYIRYLPGANNAAADFAQMPHDPIAHQMFFQATGLDAGLQSNFTAYKNYVKGRITDLVASIKTTVDAAEVSEGRTIELTASVWRDPDIGENDYMQDYRTWLENEYLDIAMPMIYLSSSNDNLFNPNLQNSLNIPTNSKVAPILGVYLHTATGGGVALTASELSRAYTLGADGVGFYGYTAMFNESLSAARQTAIKDFFTSIENPATPHPGGPGNVIDDFEVDDGHFNWNWPSYKSPQTVGLAEGTMSGRVTTEAQRDLASQKITLVAAGTAAWTLRHNSGIGAVAHPSGNVPLDPTGSIGFWLKTANTGITVRISIDDPTTAAGSTALERSIALPVTSDNQWHLYQWNLDDANVWDAFAGGADGAIDGFNGKVSIDSIWLSGAGNAEVYLDTVSHNPAGLLAGPTPGDFNGDGSVNSQDFAKWSEFFGMHEGALMGQGDADGNHAVQGQDFLAWQRSFGAPGTPAANAAGEAVPEPTAAWLAATLAVLLLMLAWRERGERVASERG